MVVEGMWVQVCLMREREIGGGGCVTFSQIHFFVVKIQKSHYKHIISS